MRARNIKPGFFLNEELADVGSFAQLLFIGLWQLADREGKLEDRPRRIKAEIFPYYEPKPSIETLLNHLTEKQFLIRYKVGKSKIIKIVNFEKHQSPHHTEKNSILPDPCESPLITSDSLSINGELTVNSPLLDGEYPPDSLIPDSLIPDSLIPDSLEKDLSPVPAPLSFSPQNLAELWNEMAPVELSKVHLPLSRNPKMMTKIKDTLKRHPERSWWEDVIVEMHQSPFLRGQNGKGWKANFDFMVDKAEVILDGKYAGGPPKLPPPEPKGYDGIRNWLNKEGLNNAG